MSNVIGVTIDGETEWHVVSIGATDHNTMCGIDADDPNIGHTGTVEPKRGQKINCQTCKTMWLGMRSLRLRAANFE